MLVFGETACVTATHRAPAVQHHPAFATVADAHLPDAGQSAEVDVPALLRALVLDDVHALGVGADLGRVQRVGHVLDQLLLIHALHHEERQMKAADSVTMWNCSKPCPAAGWLHWTIKPLR